MSIAYIIIIAAIALFGLIVLFATFFLMFKKDLVNSYGFCMFRLIIWSVLYILLCVKAILSIFIGFSFIQILTNDIYCLVISTFMIYKNYKLVLKNKSKSKNKKNISSEEDPK